jgi:RNA polymerase sigma-70 factor (ECF subfamily)
MALGACDAMTTLALAAPRYGVSARLAGAPAAAPHVLDANRLGDHLDRLYRAALGMTGSPADAEDLVQDVCVRVLTKPRLITNGDDLGYLLRVLRNTFISNRRALARRPAVATAPEDLERLETARNGSDPERAFEANQLYAKIAELPEHQRDALVAVDLLGLSYKEAAAHLDVPDGTIMSRLFRARQALAA